MSTQELEQWCQLAVKYNVSSVKTSDGTEIKFFAHKMEDQPVILSRPIGEKHGMPTDDEMLFHSCPTPFNEDELAARPPVMP